MVNTSTNKPLPRKGATTFSIMTFSIKALIWDSQHNNTLYRVLCSVALC